MKKYAVYQLVLGLSASLLSMNAIAQLFPNGDFEAGPPATTICQCPTGFTCGNDAGRVVDGGHPLFTVGTTGGCIGPTNYSPQLGAHGGTGSVYFYAGLDNIQSPAVNFAGGEEVCLEVWFCGPQGWGASGQSTANAHFSFGVDGVQVGPDITVPPDTPWTLHTFTVIMTPGNHTFSILSGGAAQYSLWFDDFNANLCSVTPCDPGWTPTTACSTDPPINLDALITGDTGGTWSGTGVTGNTFDPSSGTQSITYSSPNSCDSTATISVTTSADASWTPPGTLCITSPSIDLNTLISGTAGGTWSGTGVTGSMFDPSGGSQSITYTVGTAPCDDVSTQTINVVTSADASWTAPVGLCLGDAPVDLSTFVTGNPGGTWTGTGMTGSTFDPSGGSQSITYTVGTAPCDDALTLTITVTALSDASWTIPTNLCESDAPIDLTTFITGTPGGTWSGTGISGSMFDPSAGTQSITYTVGTGGCQNTLTQTITVNTAPDPTWTNLSVCAGDPPINLNGQITGTTGGTWSGTGVSGTTFDPSSGSQSVTYTVTAGSCSADLTQTINVVDPVVNVNGTSVSCFGLADGSATATVAGGSGNYSYSWNTTPAQTTATATGLGPGSYTVTVTDLDAGCIITQSVDIAEPAAIILSMTAFDACDPMLGSAAVSASGGVGGFQYSWSPVTSIDSLANGIDSTMAYVTVTDGNGCSQNDSVFVTVYPAPTIFVNSNTTIYYGDFANLSADGGVSYLWSPADDLDCDTCANPIAVPDVTTEYCVRVTDVNGCVDTACTTVNIEIVCRDVFVPSAFSPNDDGENDLECVYSDCIEQMTFSIYNRWGEKVFETNNMNICWDGTWNGKELNSAVFVYTLEGFLINGQAVSQKGNISLIR
jgi:gliding motility-associated-like protein